MLDFKVLSELYQMPIQNTNLYNPSQSIVIKPEIPLG